MANRFQQQSLFRKVTYIGLILVLLTVSLVHRKFVVEAQATALQLREQSQGEVELTSSAVRYLLSGSRGLANTFLWYLAIEKQKKQQWNEMDLLVRSITKLQPHFITPWLFQSWNLAFNVSVEFDQTRDKYFYVSRGVQLLAEGERRNQGSLEEITTPSGKRLRFPGNPEMRFNVGFFYQLKIGNSDEKYAMRSLLDLSCIDPDRRDPNRFWAVRRGKRVVNQALFEEFCRRNPRLVRRLREQMGRDRPADVVAFLEDNREVPSRFEESSAEVGPAGTLLKRPREQFPILPPRERMSALPDTEAREFPFSFDVYQAAWAWYLYAQEPLPPPARDMDAEDRPYDQVHYRKPKMTPCIFRNYPARALVYAGENLEEEGWFDDEGWTIKGWFEDGAGRPRTIAVGRETKYHSGPAWQRGYDAYRAYGVENGLVLTSAEMATLEGQAQLYWQKQALQPQDPGKGLPPELRAGFEAEKKLRWNHYVRSLTNFHIYLNQAAVEARPEAIYARKLFFQAQQLADEGARERALEGYERALPFWLDLLLANQDYRSITDIQTETYEMQIKYLKLLQQVRKAEIRSVVTGLAQLGLARPGFSPVVSLPVLDLDENQQKSILPIRTVQGPFEMIYVYELPEPGRTQLQEALLQLTQGALPVPLAVTAYQRNWMLVAADPRAASGARGGWRPLLTEAATHQTRERLRLGQARAVSGQAEQPKAAP